MGGPLQKLRSCSAKVSEQYRHDTCASLVIRVYMRWRIYASLVGKGLNEMLQEYHLDILVTAITAYTLGTEWVDLKAAQDPASILALWSHAFSRRCGSARLPQFKTWPLFTSWLFFFPRPLNELLFGRGLYWRKYGTPLQSVHPITRSTHNLRCKELHPFEFKIHTTVYIKVGLHLG